MSLEPAAGDARGFQVVYQDEHLLVLDKPSGLLAVPGRGPDLQDCLSARVRAVCPTALVVHRLDRDTSGLMLMALDPLTQRALGRQFEERTVQKTYQALVWGTPAESEGHIDLPIRKDFDNPPRHRIDHEHGRDARTLYRVIERLGSRSRLELRPTTGRSHQLRVHLATIGHPILGDPLYAPDPVQMLASRLMLHAIALAIAHPADGRPLSWTLPCPF